MKKVFNKWFDNLLVKMLTLIGFSSTFAFMACYAPPLPDGNISISPTSLSFTANGGEQTVTVQSDEAWTASTMSPYVTVTYSSGTGKQSYALVKVEPNYYTESRYCSVSIRSSSDLKMLTIKQDGMLFSVEPDSIVLSGEQGSMQSLNIRSDFYWTISAPQFVEMSSTRGYGSAVVTVTANSENRDSVKREGRLYVSSGIPESTKRIAVTQLCKE